MLNFTIGPVMSSEEVCAIGGEQVPYFRTPEFSQMMKESEELMVSFADAPAGSRAVFITGSGTASMEAVVMNTLNEQDRVLVINGGGFGKRFTELMQLHEIPHTEILLEAGKTITESDLQPFDGQGYTALVVNIHETSTGVYYDINMLSEFCKRNQMFFIVDAISSFLADRISMTKDSVDVMITGSQKALACPPGISLIVLAPRALERVQNNKTKCMYLDLKDALKNGERGQTPFTPAVGILRQIHFRLKQIQAEGGVEEEIKKIGMIAEDFREKIKDLPFEIASDSLSNAVTPLRPKTASAKDIFTVLKDEYHIWICPNGGAFEQTLFRVGHIGSLSVADNDTLIEAFNDMKHRGII